MKKSKLRYSWNLVKDIDPYGMLETMSYPAYSTLAKVKNAIIAELWDKKCPQFRPVHNHKSKIMNLTKRDFKEGSFVEFTNESNGFSLRLKMIPID